MKLSRDVSLCNLNSFSVDARARKLIELESTQDLPLLSSQHCFDANQDLILGAGSNVLFARDIEGTVILNRITGKKIIAESDDSVLVEASSGENWHDLVIWSLDNGLHGIENLVLIPGQVGAAPIQNIGAYGVELADVLDSVQALDLASGKERKFTHAECRFSYRNSRFKKHAAGRFLITSIRLRLQRTFTARLEYAGLQAELQNMGINTPTARQVSTAIMCLRRHKLPDPAMLSNAGSFFKNPRVARDTADALASDSPELPVHATNSRVAKLSAAWMIEHCGWKGYRQGDAGVSAQHALVLVNHGHATGRQILELAEAIVSSVKDRFGIELEPEPRIIQ